MSASTRLAALAALSLVASAAFAGGTITSGDASLQLVGNPAFGTTFGDTNAYSDTGATDTLYKLTWYYRTPNSSGGNQLFSNLVSPTESYSGNTATLTYVNNGPLPVGFERFDAKVYIKLTDGGSPNQFTIEQKVVFTARPENTGTVTYQVFSLLDPDLSGTSTDDNISVIDPAYTRIQLTDTFTSDAADAYGLGATKFEINTGSALRGKLNSGANDLNSSVLPLTSIDAAFAYQWTLTLAPGQSKALTTKYAYNLRACRADFNSNGAITVQDIFDFLSAWFGNSPFADFNSSGSVTVQDIFDFLSAWFAGAC